MTGTSVTRTSRAARVAAILGAVVVVILIAAPWWAGRADMRLMGEIFLYLSLACLWNLLAGYAGLVSVGQQAYVGFGGYMLFALTMFAGLPPVAAIAIAGVLGPSRRPRRWAVAREPRCRPPSSVRSPTVARRAKA